jgi:hypothetical protein
MMHARAARFDSSGSTSSLTCHELLHPLSLEHGAIRVRTGLPNYEDLVDEGYDWMYSVYGEVKELIPRNAPEP